MHAVALLFALLTVSHQVQACLESRGVNEISLPSTTTPHNTTDANLTVADLCYMLNVPGVCVIEERTVNTIYVQAGFCITSSETSTKFAVTGYCPYFVPNLMWRSSIVTNNYILPISLTVKGLTNLTCEPYNREGELCRKCKAGYGPAVYAFGLMCQECHYSPAIGWMLYFFCVLFPITVFYIFVIIFNIQATAPPFSAFVLMCQTFCMMELTYVPLEMRLGEYKKLSILLQAVRVLCGFWNLDFFRYLVPPFCVSSNLSTLQALSLEYVSVIYPLVLILVTFICIELHARNCTLLTVMWKPFHKCITRLRRSLDPGASIVNAFSTFLLLNLSKIIFVARNSLYSTPIYRADSMSYTDQTSFLYADPSIHQFSRQHLPYLLFSTIALFTFCFIPTILLCLYPTKFFRRLLQCCLPLRWQYGLGVFMDAFQGYYKDGRDRTRDFRAASSIHLILVSLIVYRTVYINRYVRSYELSYTHQCLVAASLFYALARPCRQCRANIIQSLMYFLTAVVIQFIISCTYHCRKRSWNKYLSMLLCLLTPHVILYAYVVYKISKTFINYSYLWSIAGKLTRSESHRFLARLVRDKDDESSFNERSQLLV